MPNWLEGRPDQDGWWVITRTYGLPMFIEVVDGIALYMKI